MKKIISFLIIAILVLGIGSSCGAQTEQSQECIKILQKIKVTINVNDTTREEATFERGAIVSLKEITSAGSDPNKPHPLCSHIKENEGIQTVCTNNVSGATKCYVWREGDFGGIVIMNTITNVSNWIFYIVILFSTIMIVWGGFTYLTSAGDPGKAGKGKSIITYALIGLAVALLAKVMPSVLKFFLGL